MVAASVGLGFFIPTIWGSHFDCYYLIPCFMFGVCVAEMRFHLHHRVKAVLGHWISMDLSIIAFVIVVVWPYTNSIHLGSDGAKGAATSMLLNSALIWSLQFLLFGLILITLSCQAYHKKRSLIVFGIFQSSFFTDLLGKYCYPLYLVQIVIIFSPNYMKSFVCMGLPIDGAAYNQCAASVAVGVGGEGGNFTSAWLYKVLLLVVSIVLAMCLQWFQDTYVATAHVAVMGFVQSGGIGMYCWKCLSDEQNPFSGLVLAYWPPADSNSDGELETGDSAVRG